MGLKFVSLHNHDGHSVYDAIGTPEDLVKQMLKNAGEDSGALAITNHGNMNSIGDIVATQKKYDKKGAPVKLLYGVEAYYVPSLDDWQVTKIKVDEERKEQKRQKKESPETAELVIENEAESKDWTKKFYDPINRRNHLVLVAQNQQGLQNLYRIVSRSYREGFYKKPRIDLEMLHKHNKGLIVSTACIGGIPGYASFHPDLEKKEDSRSVSEIYNTELGPLMEIFGPERFYLELQFNRIPQQRIVNKDIINFAKETGFKLVATADCHYPNPNMFRDREIYRLLGYQMQKKNPDLSILEKTIDEIDAELYLKNGDQMFQAYKETFYDICQNETLIKEAIERTYAIAHDLCDTVRPDNSYKLPKTFQVTETIKSPFDKLKSLTLAGLKKKQKCCPWIAKDIQTYIDRAVYELDVIKNIGVEEYFLAKLEIIDVLREHMLIGCGRGSAAGSLVCYLFGITMIDPIRNGLLFERFMSVSRQEIPDIDSDVEMKDKSLNILKKRFGDENVLTISNYNRLKLRSLVKDISKLYGVPFEEVNKVTKVMENEARDKIMNDIGHDQKLYEFTFEKAKLYSPTLNKFLSKYPKIETHIENLYKEIKSTGSHAGGVLIVPDAESCLPVIRIRGVDQCPITEGMTAQHLQYFGLIKFDVLGLTTLRIIRRCIEQILISQGIRNPTIDEVWDWYDKNLHPDVLDPADPKVFRNVYHKGQWPSVFQFAEKNVQNFCKKAKPNSITDLSAITSIYRPGALKDNGDKKYLWASEPDKIKEFKKEHSIIQKILGPSRSVLCFQEQFMLLAHELAGFSLEEADKLRKLLVKPATTLAEEIKKERVEIGKKFISGCIKSGLNKERAIHLWEREILGSISYSFNKSHAVSYSYNSYHCAWLFTYFKEHWIRACLECDPDLEKTINVVRSLGFKIFKPDINLSSAKDWYMAENNVCIPALTSLKGIGDTAAKELARLRPNSGFKDIEHFFFNRHGIWRWSKVNKKALQILIRTEAFESLGCVGPNKLFENYRHMNESLFDVEKFDKIKKKKVSLEHVAALACTDDWTVTEKMTAQREIQGFYDKELIVGEFMDIFEEFNVQGVDEVADEMKKPRVWGVVEKVVAKVTKTGKPFAVVTATGASDKPYTFRCWNTDAATSNVWREGNVVVFSLDWSDEWNYSLSRYGKVLRLTK